MIKSLISSLDTFDAVKQVINCFSSPGARLITLSSQSGHETAEVTHEALFNHWQLLNNWLDSCRDDIRFHDGVTQGIQDLAGISFGERGLLGNRVWPCSGCLRERKSAGFIWLTAS